MATGTAIGANDAPPKLDWHLNKFSQGLTVLLSALGYIFHQNGGQWFVVALAVILTLSAAFPEVGPYRLLYKYVVVPLHIIKPRIVEDDPAPHRFAQAVGAVFTIASSLVLLLIPDQLTPLISLGWILNLIVLVLSFLNFSISFCAGCFVYYQLGKIGLMPRVRYAGGFRWLGVR